MGNKIKMFGNYCLLSDSYCWIVANLKSDGAFKHLEFYSDFNGAVSGLLQRAIRELSTSDVKNLSEQIKSLKDSINAIFTGIPTMNIEVKTNESEINVL